jgi:hypothetical protein
VAFLPGETSPRARKGDAEERSEESAEAVVATGLAGSEGPNVKESEARSSLEGAMPQMTRQLELPLMGRGEAPRGRRSAEAPTAARGSGHSGNDGDELMERVLSRPNLKAALKRVRKNKGSPRNRRDEHGGAAAVPVGELGTAA